VTRSFVIILRGFLHPDVRHIQIFLDALPLVKLNGRGWPRENT
jgi:hypothetical protein